MVGGIILAMYFWIARRENLFSGLAKRPAAEKAPSTMEPASEYIAPTPILPDEILPNIDAVLDDLLAGKITRDQAAMHIQGMMSK